MESDCVAYAHVCTFDANVTPKECALCVTHQIIGERLLDVEGRFDLIKARLLYDVEKRGDTTPVVEREKSSAPQEADEAAEGSGPSEAIEASQVVGTSEILKASEVVVTTSGGAVGVIEPSSNDALTTDGSVS